MLPSFFDSIVALIVKTSTDLPPDVRAAMKNALAEEDEGTRAKQPLTIIGQNIDQAADIEGAICQDTGMPTLRDQEAGRRKSFAAWTMRRLPQRYRGRCAVLCPLH